MNMPEPIVDEPTVETLMRWKDEGHCQATDGCWLERDVPECEHGHPSWLVVLGLEPDAAGD